MLWGVASCVDSDYDLSNIDSDDITIGTDDSEFVMPVATIRVATSRLNQDAGEGKVSITELYREADIWLPSVLPGNAEYVEVLRLSEDDAYLTEMLSALFEEMDESETKCTEVCELIAEKYREAFVDFLPAGVPSEIRQQILAADPDEAAGQIAELYLQMTGEVTEAITQLASGYLTDMQLEPVRYEVSGLNLSNDVRKMLTDNLDDAETENPVNALYLTGTIESELPFRCRLEPRLEQTRIDFGEIVVENGRTTELHEVRFFTEDFDRMNEGSELVMPVSIERYYPALGLQDSQIVRIHLSLRKTGALQL